MIYKIKKQPSPQVSSHPAKGLGRAIASHAIGHGFEIILKYNKHPLFSTIRGELAQLAEAPFSFFCFFLLLLVLYVILPEFGVNPGYLVYPRRTRVVVKSRKIALYFRSLYERT